MDADLSHNPKEIINFIENLENYPFIIGSRYIAGGVYDERLKTSHEQIRQPIN